MLLLLLLALLLIPITGQTCGGGSKGDGRCSGGLCCSKYGYCGSTADFCNGYCGNGVVGSGRCANATCCNKDGYCGTGAGYCDNPTNTGTAGARDTRLVTFLGDWTSCPSAASLAYYTHIYIAFAHTYTYDSSGNKVCSTTCQVYAPDVCNFRQNPGLIDDLHRAGKKVVLSFSTLGGAWATPPNGCWEYCYGREEQVSDQLVSIVQSMKLSGVDIDYEYFADGTLGFTKGAQAQYFLSQLSVLLRQKLPAGAIVSHSPMDYSIKVGSGYFSVLQQIADIIDWVQPQYYTGHTDPVKNGLTGGTRPTIDHYNALVNDVFHGDASKITFGFCPSCSSGATGAEAATVMQELKQYYPCNGGAYFWMASADFGGDWSQPVVAAISSSAGCSHKDKCCPNKMSGLRSYANCTQFYQCSKGEVTGPLLGCGRRSLFDETAGMCRWKRLVATCSVDTCS